MNVIFFWERMFGKAVKVTELQCEKQFFLWEFSPPSSHNTMHTNVYIFNGDFTPLCYMFFINNFTLNIAYYNLWQEIDIMCFPKDKIFLL